MKDAREVERITGDGNKVFFSKCGVLERLASDGGGSFSSVILDKACNGFESVGEGLV